MDRSRLLLCLVVLGATPFCAGAGSFRDGRQTVAGPVAAELLRVIDGDTIEVRARIWLDLDVTTRVRLAGIDAPELDGACPEERRLAQIARTSLGATLGLGPVWLSDIRHDKYGGRVVADVLLRDGHSASAAMLASGAAAEWGTTPLWCPP